MAEGLMTAENNATHSLRIDQFLAVLATILVGSLQQFCVDVHVIQRLF